MRRAIMLAPVLAALAALSACGEEPQALGTSKAHVAPYQGAQNQFVAPGWKAGDKADWERALKTRMQNSQNEYTKTN